MCPRIDEIYYVESCQPEEIFVHIKEHFHISALKH